MPARITQKQVAEAARLHPSTVSLALRAQAKIPKATRDRVIAAAERLGYQRDPMLSALPAYRKSRSHSAFHGVLGWLVWTDSPVHWQSSPEYSQYYVGACARAAELGY